MCVFICLFDCLCVYFVWLCVNVSSIRGHGTYVEGETIKAAVAGVVERVNKLICVRPVRSRYI